jgi:DHA3 family macrolide efflux protein-like MFS transporter
MEPQRAGPTGMPGFTIVWIGQVVSLLGTGMTRFALTIWAWEVTGKATALALVWVFAAAPTVLFSPVAGALVDRWNRKLVMMLSDLAAGSMTVVVLLLYATGHLQVWHLYVTGALAGAFEAFQWPAYSAAVTTMLPKAQYARASGMMSLAESASGVFAPLAGSMLMRRIGIAGVGHPPAEGHGGRACWPGKPAAGVAVRVPVHPGTPQPAGPAIGVPRHEPDRCFQFRRPRADGPGADRKR